MMVATPHNRRRGRRHNPTTPADCHILSHASLQTTLQWAILISATLFFIVAHDHHAGLVSSASVRFLQDAAEQPRQQQGSDGSIYEVSRSLRTTSKGVSLRATNTENVQENVFWSFSPPSLDFLSPLIEDVANNKEESAKQNSLELFLNNSMVNEVGKELVRSYQHHSKNESEPLRHLQFDHLQLPDVPQGSPTMVTAYLQSTVVTQAPWFPHHKVCNETCCAQKVAISLNQDQNRIINAVDGADLADLVLLGHTPAPIHKFFASELTDAVIPCLQPGVIIHADSYRGPITRFFHDHRPNITVPYILMTTKTDGDTPISFFQDRLATDPLLLAWYGINPKYELGAHHPKFRMMPLGLTGNKYRQQPDLDLLMEARNHTNPFGGSKDRWLNASLWEHTVDTSKLLFVKFGFHENALHRAKPWTMACENRQTPALEDMSCNKNKGGNPRQTYAAAAKYPFGLSPPGNGLDCFRTYEYLLNGIIPIVQAQPEYDELFEDLPVLQIKGWRYSQQELVKLMHEYVMSPAFRNNTFEKGWNRLFLQHWRQQVLRDAGRLDEIVTDPTTGNDYYTAWQYSLYKKPLIEHAIPEHVEIRKRKQAEKEKAKANELLKQAEAQQKTQQQPHRATGEVERPQAFLQHEAAMQYNLQERVQPNHHNKHHRRRHHHHVDHPAIE